MFRRLIATLVAFVVVTLASTGFAFAAVDVNNADQTQLQTIDGIGPAISAKIIAERKNGSYKDWDDLVKRVPGIGDKNSAKFSSGGLTVGGAMKPDTKLDPSLMKRTNQATPAAPAAPVARGGPATPAPAAPPAPAKTPADPAPAATASTAKASATPAASAPGKSAASPTKADAAPPAETKVKSSKAAKKEEAARKEEAAASSGPATTPATTVEPKAKKTRAKKGEATETPDATPKK